MAYLWYFFILSSRRRGGVLRRQLLDGVYGGGGSGDEDRSGVRGSVSMENSSRASVLSSFELKEAHLLA